MSDVDLIKKELVIMKDFFVKVIQIVPNFDITNISFWLGNCC